MTPLSDMATSQATASDSVAAACPAQPSLARPSLARGHDYIILLKPRVMALVVFTALVGLMIAPQPLHPLLGVLAILCIAVGGGASGALNMWYESDIDALMQRTKSRPIPAGLVSRDSVLIFALILAAFAVLVMGVFINWFSAAFLGFTIFFYAVIYTIWLKRSTPQNIVIGGAAGAFPPMIGWAAATGTVSLESVILFLIIFLWTPPHFWALSLFVTTDYEAAQIPMMPNVRGARATQNQILLYAILMGLSGIAPYAIGFAGLAYGLFALILGILFVFYAWALWRVEAQDAMKVAAKRLFLFSLLYLTGIFSALLVENIGYRLLLMWGFDR